MIGAFCDGDYELVACRRIDERRGRLEYAPNGWPYGGTGCMEQLLIAFGHRVVGRSHESLR